MSNSYAVPLIKAVQSLDLSQLRDAITKMQSDEKRRVKKLHDEWLHVRKSQTPVGYTTINHVDDRYGSLELTALHVACKCYAEHHSDPKLAEIFDNMVAMLLEAGAEPSVEIGAAYGFQKCMGTRQRVVIRSGQTVAEVCRGHIAPALARHYQSTKAA